MSKSKPNPMGKTLFESMTGKSDRPEAKLDPYQADALIHAVLPRFFTTGPMAALGLKMKITTDDDGWTIRIDR